MSDEKFAVGDLIKLKKTEAVTYLVRTFDGMAIEYNPDDTNRILLLPGDIGVVAPRGWNYRSSNKDKEQYNTNELRLVFVKGVFVALDEGFWELLS